MNSAVPSSRRTQRGFSLNVSKRTLLIFGILSFCLSSNLLAQVDCPTCPIGQRDTLPPHARCKPTITASLDGTGYRYISPLAFDDFSGDNCPVIIISASKTRYYCTDVGTQTVVFTVRDSAGNRATCTTRVTIRDTLRPVLMNCPRDTVLVLSAGECSQKRVTYTTPSVSDNCGAVLTRTAGLASGSFFPLGNTVVTYTAVDSGRNTATCSFRVSIADKAPTVTCKPSYTVSLSRTNPTALVTPLDVFSSVADNCTPLSHLSLRIRRTGRGTGFPDSASLSFGCLDTIQGVSVEVWARDAAGLMSQCQSVIYTTDPTGICRPVLPNVLVAGNVLTEEAQGVTAQIHMTGNSFSAVSLKGDEHGGYLFRNLLRGIDYQFTPRRDSDWVNGVTTYDVALLSRHILGVVPFSSPYKYIAADVNRDGSVDALDMLLVRRLVLRQIPNFPNNRSWRFVPKTYNFPLDIEPQMVGFPESIQFTPLTDTVTNADFIAMKIGDLDGNAVNSFQNPPQQGSHTLLSRATNKLIFSTTNVNLENGQTHDIVLRADQPFDVAGFQATLNFDKLSIKILAIEPINLLDFNESNYAVFADRGKCTFSWNGSNSSPSPVNIFLVKVQALRPVRLSEVLSLTSDLTPAEAYSSAGERMPFEWRFIPSSPQKSDWTVSGAFDKQNPFVVYQNEPNPFSQTTVIRFQLKESGMVHLTIFDEMGRVLQKRNLFFEKGLQTWQVNWAEIPPSVSKASGVFFYRMETASQVVTKRMVRMK